MILIPVFKFNTPHQNHGFLEMKPHIGDHRTGVLHMNGGWDYRNHEYKICLQIGKWTRLKITALLDNMIEHFLEIFHKSKSKLIFFHQKNPQVLQIEDDSHEFWIIPLILSNSALLMIPLDYAIIDYPIGLECIISFIDYYPIDYHEGKNTFQIWWFHFRGWFNRWLFFSRKQIRDFHRPSKVGLLIGHGVKATDEESTLQHLDMGGTIDQWYYFL